MPMIQAADSIEMDIISIAYLLAIERLVAAAATPGTVHKSNSTNLMYIYIHIYEEGSYDCFYTTRSK